MSIRIHHRLAGPAGAPVVTLAHPLGATLEIWNDHVAALASRYRVLTYDVRGHGRSEAPPGPYTVDQMAADLDRLLDALGIGATHFVGLSMGGLIGMTAALAVPARIRSLVLCDTTACYGPGLAPMWEDRIGVAETAGMTETLIEKTMEIWFTPAFRHERPGVVDRVRAMLRRTDPKGYAAAIRAIGFVDLRERLGAVRCPTLVVVGEKDPGTTPAMAREILTRIPGADLLVLADAMHCAPVEAESQFTPALLEFLAARP
ncbi:MAG: alpha/beta fold hydrolase [Candidatus Rokuibacteriota bacterium]